MKVVVVYITIFMISLSFLILMDVVAGVELLTSIRNLQQSFSASTTADEVLIVILLSIPFLSPLVTWLKRRKKV